ncbi:AAEL005566-PA [Aedes aegypti]|uniref:AAEL005566-PA n=1 Tax=Aedes aegypti TaxID=7159 RepID=Q179L1_AEDAE|nr:AAEL005566-PA [Aedes aegypti]
MAYNCTVCVFGSSIKSGGYQCVYCGNSFTDAGPSNSVGEKAASENELPRSGSEKWIFRCTFCNQDYVNREGMWNHLDSHDIADVGKSLHCKEIIVCYDLHECLICNDKQGYSEDMFSVHIQEAHNGFYLRCSSCNELFRSEEQKSEHVSNHCKAACVPNMDTAVNDDIRQHANVTNQSEVSTNGNILPVDGESAAQLPKHLIPGSGPKPPVWNSNQLQEAITAVVTQQSSITQASNQYNVPKGTLYDNILGKRNRMAILHELVLSENEEDAILNFACSMSHKTHSKRTKQSLSSVLDFMSRFGCFQEKAERFKFGGIAAFQWWWAFCRKHSIDSPRSLSDGRRRGKFDEMGNGGDVLI